ncbi:MAG: alpha-L-fucosidase [Butyricimonas faecihominis]
MEHVIICPVRGNGILPGTGPGSTSEIGTVAGFEVRFFVHWGPYSQKGYCESWTICSEDVDWIQRDTMISYDEYYRNYVGLKKTFNPVKFNPEYWADLAKRGRYEVFRVYHETP